MCGENKIFCVFNFVMHIAYLRTGIMGMMNKIEYREAVKHDVMFSIIQ